MSISNTPSLENGSDTAPRVSPTMIPVTPTFRDDFNGHLNPDWEWQNEDASHYKVNDDAAVPVMSYFRLIFSKRRAKIEVNTHLIQKLHKTHLNLS